MKKRYLAILLTVLCMFTGCVMEEDAVVNTAPMEEPPQLDESYDPQQAKEEDTATEERKGLTVEELINSDKVIRPVSDGDKMNDRKTEVEGEDYSQNGIDVLSDASVSLFAEAAKSDPGSNVLISPASLIMALGMTENGARGETLLQMEKVVNGGLGVDEFNALCGAFSKRLLASEDVRWNNANAIWVKDDGLLRLRDDFVSNVKEYYSADIKLAEFDSKTVRDINDWISEQTEGRINDMIDSLDRTSRALLVNAIAFDGEWMEAYKDEDIIEDSVFTNADGSESKVTMLSSSEDRCFKFAGGKGFVRPYKGGEYSFVGILPNEDAGKEGLSDFIDSISGDSEEFAKAVREAKDADVYVLMPEFKCEYGIIDMKNNLAGMGMTDAFDPAKADFGDMMEAAGNGKDDTDAGVRLWIDKVLHSTYIDVNRKGTEAAAATVVEMRLYAAAKPALDEVHIELDRPFVYAIVDNETGLPVFMGCINHID